MPHSYQSHAGTPSRSHPQPFVPTPSSRYMPYGGTPVSKIQQAQQRRFQGLRAGQGKSGIRAVHRIFELMSRCEIWSWVLSGSTLIVRMDGRDRVSHVRTHMYFVYQPPLLNPPRRHAHIACWTLCCPSASQDPSQFLEGGSFRSVFTPPLSLPESSEDSRYYSCPSPSIDDIHPLLNSTRAH